MPVDVRAPRFVASPAPAASGLQPGSAQAPLRAATCFAVSATQAASNFQPGAAPALLRAATRSAYQRGSSRLRSPAASDPQPGIARASPRAAAQQRGRERRCWDPSGRTGQPGQLLRVRARPRHRHADFQTG
ncbi:hypothetical protein NDU88_003676 [Pleurodeles waltl]|uniref:Uncharacterized protein n=1 Tax=Pleurodeles waltl TaxID=8319 RepID=A0AAV7T7B3_PLEWA|nr:hypothetical protein NDU88_003676 [Pleurodeles waltl]